MSKLSQRLLARLNAWVDARIQRAMEKQLKTLECRLDRIEEDFEAFPAPDDIMTQENVEERIDNIDFAEGFDEAVNNGDIELPDEDRVQEIVREAIKEIFSNV